MRERVEIIDGKITIDSKIGEGTIVMIQVKFD
jgi:signal transduction histidine kinase